MALNVTCNKGHMYVAADIYMNWPVGVPHCPICYREWQKTEEKMADENIEGIWDLCGQLTNAIEKAVKSGYKVDVSLDQYRLLGWRDEFTVIKAMIYKGVTADDKTLPTLRRIRHWCL